MTKHGATDGAASDPARPDARQGQARPALPDEGDREGAPWLDVTSTLRGRRILLIGTTGFVGKVALCMLLDRYPDIGRVYCLVRPGAGNTADERFYKKVAGSEAFRPLRERHGDGLEAWLAGKIVAIPGDIGRPLCNFSDAQFAAFEADGGLDVIINSAGLVSFTPPLESALRINAQGAKNVLDAARRAKARLVHVSTCFVCGEREGEIWEDEPVVGYFPRKGDGEGDLPDKDFDAAAEMADCQRLIDQVREQANDRAHISLFRERAAASLEAQRRDPDDVDDLKLTVARERKLWVNERLTELGMERAKHWGWTNTYTYTKSLGEQVILADREVAATIVRPAVVESAVRFPFAGWNEGFNTTAPLVYLVLKGHRQIMVGADTALDVIPVDFIAAGILLATAAVLAGVHEPVYQLGTSDVNRVTSRRLTELTALAVRRHWKRKADAGEETWRNRLKVRLEAMPVTDARFQRLSAPMVKRIADKLIETIDDKLPRWGAPRLEAFAERAKDELAKVSRFTGQVVDVIEIFKPFTYERDVTFRCDNMRALWNRVTPEDRERLWWAPEAVDWRTYWIDIHFEGLQKWTFPTLDDEFGPKPRSVYTYKDLLELWDATTKLHKNRVALRLRRKPLSRASREAWGLERSEDRGIPTPRRPSASAREPARDELIDDLEPQVVTYGLMAELAMIGAAQLRQRGAGSARVMLMGEGRPEWGISYFAILKAGSTVVPLDKDLSAAEVVNLAKVSGARALVLSTKIAERLCADLGLALPVDDEEEARARRRSVVEGRRVEERPRAVAQQAFARWLAAQGQGELAAMEVLGFDALFTEPDVSPGAPPPPVKSDSVASLIFTSGTTGTPKGVMLSHKNFTSMVAKLAATFTLYKHDNLLSVLPLHHTFEFSAGFLMPLAHGASITYLEEVDADSLGGALEDGGVTGMVGVPALWQLLERKIYKNVSDKGLLVERAFDLMVDFNRSLRDKLGGGVGNVLFLPVHRKLGGRLRLLISGGSALPADTMKAFRGLGFNLYEGYGMTEAAPVLTVTRPGDDVVPGSVGRPLPGVDVKIDHPDASGIGEVIAKGPNVMLGYFQNAEATAATLQDGWLHTGDLGRFDADGNLFIVGRKKEMILGPSGENVYPDELEELYGDSTYVKELSVVGLPAGEGAETVAALVVPDYEEHAGTKDREQVRDEVREHLRRVSKSLPLYKRLKVVHLWDHDLPRTSTRKVKRREVVKELERLERAAKGGAEHKKLAAGAAGAEGTDWVLGVIASVTQRKRSDVTKETRLDSLGFDSLMFTELGVALEAGGVTLPDPAELNGLETVGDVEALVARVGGKARAAAQGRKAAGKDRERDREKEAAKADDEIVVPDLAVRIGRRLLRTGMKALYSRYLDTTVTGRAYVPPFGGYIVAANHASHLDMGLAKHALGDEGEALVALAAKDYFFDDPVRRAYFENFTNLVPMERHGSLRESLRLAAEVLQQGYVLLIFPEGTRSPDGVMADFKPSLGFLAMTNRCGILPMYLAGTHDAMAKGDVLPTRDAAVAAHLGPMLSYADVARIAAGKTRAEGYRAISQHVEGIVRRLAPKAYAWTLGPSGTTPLAEWNAAHGKAAEPEEEGGTSVTMPAIPVVEAVVASVPVFGHAP
ncbi:MAG TPA: AMP-binding protein, partial [Kofleriaceae bacterium]|nr:AMP-binding protein [Kofleriaceae bacterium]